jgi:hypothetical protein
MATIDPLRRAWSFGYWFRTAATGPPRPIVFWGTWLLLGFTSLLTLGVALVLLVREGVGRLDVGDMVGGAMFLLVIAAQWVILARMTARYVRARTDRDSPDDAARHDAHHEE